MVLRQGLWLAVTGAAVGLVGAVVVSHLMMGLLYGVRPTDPLTFAGVALHRCRSARLLHSGAARDTRRSAGRAEIRIAQAGGTRRMKRSMR